MKMLLNTYVQVYGQLPQFFEALRAGTAPEKFTRQYLKDLGFKSSNHHALIPLLKGLGFLTADGSPTTLYREFLDKSKWKKVLGAALKDKYSDIFTLKSNPSKADKSIIEGKFKSTYNTSDNVAALNANTFLALLELGDLSSSVAEIRNRTGTSDGLRKLNSGQHLTIQSEFAGPPLQYSNSFAPDQGY